MVGRLQLDIERKASTIGAAVHEALSDPLNKAVRIWAQSAQRKVVDGERKLSAWNAPRWIALARARPAHPTSLG